MVHSDQSTQLAEIMPSVNGNLWQENAAFVDGVDTTNTRYGGGSRMILPTSALAEVRSDASGYGAEYGRVVGGVTGVVTKSGTNTFHGDFQYIAQNQKWEAQSDDVPLPREDDLINSYEASFGGPILRDKLWFFAAAADNDTNQISSLAGGDLIQNIRDLGVLYRQAQLHPDAAALAGRDLHRRAGGGSVLRRSSTPTCRRCPSTTSAVASRPRAGAGRRRTTCSSRCAAPHQDSSESRTLITTTEIVPGASPDDPAGNHGAYWDTAQHAALARECAAARAGRSSTFRATRATSPRPGSSPQNELKFGVDYQDVKWESLNKVPDRYQGAGYNPSLPGGFVTPATKNVYKRDRLAGRHLQHQPGGIRFGPHRGGRSLGLQRRRALRGPGARERSGAGGAVLGGLHSAPRRHLRRRR